MRCALNMRPAQVGSSSALPAIRRTAVAGMCPSLPVAGTRGTTLGGVCTRGAMWCSRQSGARHWSQRPRSHRGPPGACDGSCRVWLFLERGARGGQALFTFCRTRGRRRCREPALLALLPALRLLPHFPASYSRLHACRRRKSGWERVLAVVVSRLSLLLHDRSCCGVAAELPDSACPLPALGIQDCTWSFDWSPGPSSSGDGSAPGSAIEQQHLWLVQGQCSAVFREQPDLDTLPRVLLPCCHYMILTFPPPCSRLQCKGTAARWAARLPPAASAAAQVQKLTCQRGLGRQAGHGSIRCLAQRSFCHGKMSDL